jgi:hypothetical protein
MLIGVSGTSSIPRCSTVLYNRAPYDWNWIFGLRYKTKVCACAHFFAKSISLHSYCWALHVNQILGLIQAFMPTWLQANDVFIQNGEHQPSTNYSGKKEIINIWLIGQKRKELQHITELYILQFQIIKKTAVICILLLLISVHSKSF